MVEIAHPMAVSSKAAAVAPCSNPMPFSSPSCGSSSITIRPGSATRRRKSISRAIGGSGKMPSRIARIASSPDIAAAAFATGPGTCQSTCRSRRDAAAKRPTLSAASTLPETVIGCSHIDDVHHITQAIIASQRLCGRHDGSLFTTLDKPGFWRGRYKQSAVRADASPLLRDRPCTCSIPIAASTATAAASFA